MSDYVEYTAWSENCWMDAMNHRLVGDRGVFVHHGWVNEQKFSAIHQFGWLLFSFSQNVLFHLSPARWWLGPDLDVEEPLEIATSAFGISSPRQLCLLLFHALRGQVELHWQVHALGIGKLMQTWGLMEQDAWDQECRSLLSTTWQEVSLSVQLDTKLIALWMRFEETAWYHSPIPSKKCASTPVWNNATLQSRRNAINWS